MGNLRASIVTFGTDEAELRTILGLLSHCRIDAVDVVDNGREGRIAQICSQYPGVAYIPHDNGGYGMAHNVSMRKSLAQNAQYHLVLNTDIQFDSEALGQMVQYMDLHPEVGMLHPRIYGLDGKDQFTARMLPTPFDLFLRKFVPEGMFSQRRSRYLLKHLDHSKPMDVAYVQGSFMLIRCSVLREVGLFDENFFMYAEDVDLSRRISQRAIVRYYPDAHVVHAHRAESYSNKRLGRIHLCNMAKYFNKWGWLFDKQRRAVNSLLKTKN